MNYIYTEHDYLAHHGVKGMKWGIRKDRERSASDADKENRKKKLKTAIKIGAGIAAAALLSYGAIKLAKTGKMAYKASKEVYDHNMEQYDKYRESGEKYMSQWQDARKWEKIHMDLHRSKNEGIETALRKANERRKRYEAGGTKVSPEVIKYWEEEAQENADLAKKYLSYAKEDRVKKENLWNDYMRAREDATNAAEKAYGTAYYKINSRLKKFKRR